MPDMDSLEGFTLEGLFNLSFREICVGNAAQYPWGLNYCCQVIFYLIVLWGYGRLLIVPLFPPILGVLQSSQKDCLETVSNVPGSLLPALFYIIFWQRRYLGISLFFSNRFILVDVFTCFLWREENKIGVKIINMLELLFGFYYYQLSIYHSDFVKWCTLHAIGMC